MYYNVGVLILYHYLLPASLLSPLPSLFFLPLPPSLSLPASYTHTLGSRIFSIVEQVDDFILWVNLFCLLCVSFLPYAVRSPLTLHSTAMKYANHTVLQVSFPKLSPACEMKGVKEKVECLHGQDDLRNMSDRHMTCATAAPWLHRVLLCRYMYYEMYT